MGNDVTWWKRSQNADENRPQPDRETGTETPGDTNAGDIVGRTGEEMPDVAHDGGHDETHNPPDTTPTNE